MAFIIEHYGAAWNPKNNRGVIYFENIEGQKTRIELQDPGEFTAVLTILATSSDARIEANGTVRSGREDLDG